eukprot:6878224-Prymnesium_polylepis.2
MMYCAALQQLSLSGCLDSLNSTHFPDSLVPRMSEAPKLHRESRTRHVLPRGTHKPKRQNFLTR